MDIEAVLERIKQAKSLRSEKEIASLLGLSPQDFSNRKRRGTLRPLLLDWAAREGVSVNWLICEEGGMYGPQGGAGGGLDKDLLRRAIEMAEQGVEESGVQLKAAKKAELIVTLYEMCRDRREVDGSTLLRLIELAS
jgi:hypothetical protein